MKKILLLAFLLASMPVFSEAKQIITHQPIRNYPYYNNYNYYSPQFSNNDLSALEKYAMNKSYPRENPEYRLERLENLVFGSTQYGDINSRYKNIETAILSRPNYTNTKTSLLRNMANYFAGQATGYTPPITNSYYPSNYGNQRYNQYSNGLFGGGYSINNSSLGSGSSIRILP